MFGLHPWTVTLRQDVHVPIDAWTAALYCAVALGGLYVTRLRPAYGVAYLIAALPLALPRYIGPTSLTIAKAALIGVAAGVLTVRPAWTGFSVPAVRVPLFLLAATVAAEVASAAHAVYLAPVAREIFKALEYAAVFGTIVLAFATDPDERPVWRALNATAAVVCLTALAQYVVGANAGIFIEGRSIPRIAGLLEGPNQLSGYLGIVLPLLVARNLVHRDGRLVALIALAAVTDLLTFSRAGIVAAVIGCAIVLAVMRPPRRVGIRFGSIAVLVVAVAIAFAVRAGFSGAYFSLNPVPQPADHLGNRAILWNAALAMWHSSPLVGVGAGNFENRLPEFGAPGVHTHANSVYLQGLAEGGILMFAVTAATFGWIAWTLARTGIRRPFVAGALAATGAFALHQLFDDLLFFPKVGGMWWIVVAIGFGEIARRTIVYQRRMRAYAA